MHCYLLPIVSIAPSFGLTTGSFRVTPEKEPQRRLWRCLIRRTCSKSRRSLTKSSGSGPRSNECAAPSSNLESPQVGVCMYVCMYVFMFVCMYARTQVRTYVCMYVKCMYVCMYVCMYLYMYLCLYVCTHARKYVRMYVCMYAKCMYVCIYVCMYVRTHASTYACMYVCMHVGMYCMYVGVYSHTYMRACMHAYIQYDIDTCGLSTRVCSFTFRLYFFRCQSSRILGHVAFSMILHVVCALLANRVLFAKRCQHCVSICVWAQARLTHHSSQAASVPSASC